MQIVPVLLMVYLALTTVYIAALAFAGRLFTKKRIRVTTPLAYRKIAVLIPAYKEDEIITNTVEEILRSTYPPQSFQVFVIADSFKESTLQKLRQYKVETISVAFDKSTKVKSLNLAFSEIKDDFDIALICDADNIFTSEYLHQVNAAFEGGARAIQTKRVAKNLNTSYAILDACSEAINNHIFRKGANALGITASLIGSGMAFEYKYLKQKLFMISAIGGFDKVLQMEVSRDRIQVIYLDHALIFDEKIDNKSQFKDQRKRWIYSQFNSIFKYFGSSVKELFKGNFNYFHLGFLTNLILPRAFYLLVYPLLIAALFILHSNLLLIAVLLFILFAVSLFISLPGYLLNKQLATALFTLPKAIFVMLHSTLLMRKSRKEFIHTTHNKLEITNPLYKTKIDQE